VTTGDFERRAAQIAEEDYERRGNVHEIVACPKCHAHVGQKCRRMPLGYGPVQWGPEVKHPHHERLRAAGIYDR